MRWLRKRWQERPWWVVKWVVGLIIIAFLAFALRNAWIEATSLSKVEGAERFAFANSLLVPQGF